MTFPTFVDTPQGLEQITAELSRHSLIAVDTELDSYFAYRGHICLVQISTADADYIIDPLAIDIHALAPIFADSQRTSIFHAGSNDIPHLRHEFGWEFSRIFDTYLASGILGNTQHGLAGLLEYYFGIILDKTYQRADWSQRPLTPEMLQYARYDTHYLIKLREVMLRELEQAKRLKDAEYAFAAATRTQYHPKAFDPDGWYKLKGVRDLPAKAYGAIRELFLWRDQEAQRVNLQPFRIIPDHQIIRLAYTNPPRTTYDLVQDANLPYLQRNPARASGLYNAIRRGIRVGAVNPPKRNRTSGNSFDQGMLKRLQALKVWRNQAAANDKVAPEFIANNKTLSALVQQAPQNVDELRSNDLLPEHIIERHGKELIKLLRTE